MGLDDQPPLRQLGRIYPRARLLPRQLYGATLTPAAAQKYCPPTWQDWYNKVGGQMSQI